MNDAVSQVVRLNIAGREEYLRIGGSGTGVAVLLVPPLFGEMNRCRRLLADIMAELAALGRGSAIPDLPGTAESLTPLDAVTLSDWRAMIAGSAALMATATTLPPVVAAFRGGAMLDDAADASARCRLSPIDGATVLRDLGRAQRLTGGASTGATTFAGAMLPAGLARPLATATLVGNATVARLAEDPKAADIRVDGAPLWRRAEPGRDRAMARGIAAQIEQMARACEIS